MSFGEHRSRTDVVGGEPAAARKQTSGAVLRDDCAVITFLVRIFGVSDRKHISIPHAADMLSELVESDQHSLTEVKADADADAADWIRYAEVQLSGQAGPW
jgi:hypothetical protein